MFRSRRLLGTRFGDDGCVLVVRPELGAPGGELLPLGPAGRAGDPFGVAGGHADRRAGDALLAADPAGPGTPGHAASAFRVGHAEPTRLALTARALRPLPAN